MGSFWLFRGTWGNQRTSTLSSRRSRSVMVRCRVTTMEPGSSACTGRLDLLFNNAGRNVKPVPLEDVPLEDFNSIVAVNLVAVRLHSLTIAASKMCFSTLALTRDVVWLHTCARCFLHFTWTPCNSAALSLHSARLSDYARPVTSGRSHHQQRLHLRACAATLFGTLHPHQARYNRPHQVHRARRTGIQHRVQPD